MKETALYRRYRPGTFDEMIGQDHVVRILKNQIQSGRLAHAYLFCGTRGTGKTSAARIFAKGVNCLSEGEKPCGVCENCVSIQKGTFFDVIEIDAASNNGVENIRELRESVKYPPAAGLCKVYIIDEVHMLSTGAFNALLKTLEEPPAHVIFILATTEPHKLPATILSRCLRLDFRRVPEQVICDRLKDICRDMNISWEESALTLIASAGDGSVRDSLSVLEQCIAAGDQKLTRKGVVDMLGTAGEEVLITMTEMVAGGRGQEALLLLDRISREGKDLRQFVRDWIYHFRNLMLSQFARDLEEILDMSCENAEKVRAQGAALSPAFVAGAISQLSVLSNQLRWATQPRMLIELQIMKLASPSIDDTAPMLLRRIEELEKQIKKIQMSASSSRTEPAAPGQELRFSVTVPPSAPQEKPPAGQPEKAFPMEEEAKTQNNEPGIPLSSQTMSGQGGEGSRDREGGGMPASACVSRKERQEDAGAVWERIFARGLSERPSLNLLKGNIIDVSEKEGLYRVEVMSEVICNFARQNQKYLESLLKVEKKQNVRLEFVFLKDARPAPSSEEAPSEEEGLSKQAPPDPTLEGLKNLFGAQKLTIGKNKE